MPAGQVAGILALVVLLVLFIGLILNHRRLSGLRTRRDELTGRMAGLEARLAQFAEVERRQALARQRAQQPHHSAPNHGGVRRVPPPRIAPRPAPRG